MIEANSAFWDFSVGFYAKPGVAAACLELQDKGGADINVVLYLFFLADRGRRPDREEIARLDAAVAGWREQVVRPLRTLRRRLKSAAAPFAGEASGRLRDEIKRNELAAERIQQHTIEWLFPPATFGHAASSREEAVRASLDAYAGLIGGLPAEAASCLIDIFCRA